MKAEDLNGLTLTVMDTIARTLEDHKRSIEKIYGCEVKLERARDRGCLTVRCKSKPRGKDYSIYLVAAGTVDDTPTVPELTSETGGE